MTDAIQKAREARFHIDRMNAWLRELWEAKSLTLHMSDGTTRSDMFGLLQNIRSDVMAIRDSALAALDAETEGEVWRDMGSAPKDGTKFDVWYFEHFDTPAHRVTDVYWSDVQDDFCTDGSYGSEEPTPLMAFTRPAYWHLIPSPPEARS